MTTDTLELRYVPLETLRRWDRNAKKHDMGALVESIERHGFRDPPAFDASLNGGEGGVVEGNGRGEALTLIKAEGRPAPRGVVVEGGVWLVPVIFGLDAPSQAAAEAYGVAHNTLTMAGGDFTALDIAGLWEPAGYAALLADLAAQGEIPVGMDGDDVDALLRELAGPVEPGAGGDEFDATPQDGPTRAQSGDLWLIDGGRHRLIVGDSTDPAVVGRLMGGERADFFVSDPPYTLQVSDDKAAKADENDQGLIHFLRAAWIAFRPHLASHAGCSWFCNYRTLNAVRVAVWARDLKSPQSAVWHKGSGATPGTPWTNDFEMLFFYGLADFNHQRGAGSNVASIPWQGGTREYHPAEKPVAVYEFALSPMGEGDLIVDAFGGSGPTLIAAHRLGRRAYLCELEPRYADVILRRAEAEGLTVERAP